MPRRKVNQPQPVVDTRYDNLDEWVSESANVIRTRVTSRYDGVLGTPDSWIPENFQREFTTARNRLLDGGYTADQVRNLMAQEIRRYRIAVRNPLNPISYGGFPLPPPVRTDVLVLAHIKTAVRLGPEKGLAFLTDQSHADKVQMAERYRQDQSRKAKRPRGKLFEANGQTINEIIGRLAKGKPDDSAKELWPHFYSELDDYHLNPKEDDQKSVIEYDSNDGGRKTIAFGTFKKLVSQYRTGRKKLP